MNSTKIKFATRTLAKDQPEYRQLEIRDIVISNPDGGEMPAMQSCWKPSPEDLVALMNGGFIYLSIIGITHPPVMLEVGDENHDVPDALNN